MLPESIKRVRWLTRDEADRLIAELSLHLANMVRFSLETGLRRSNVTGLQWSQVDLVRKTPTSQGQKSDSRSTFERSDSSAAQTDRRASGSFITFNGKAVNQASTKAWYKALKRTGIEIFRGYDSGTWQAGIFKKAPRCLYCKSWADGQRRKWCRSMRTCLVSISPNG